MQGNPYKALYPQACRATPKEHVQRKVILPNPGRDQARFYMLQVFPGRNPTQVFPCSPSPFTSRGGWGFRGSWVYNSNADEAVPERMCSITLLNKARLFHKPFPGQFVLYNSVKRKTRLLCKPFPGLPVGVRFYS